MELVGGYPEPGVREMCNLWLLDWCLTRMWMDVREDREQGFSGVLLVYTYLLHGAESFLRS